MLFWSLFLAAESLVKTVAVELLIKSSIQNCSRETEDAYAFVYSCTQATGRY